MVNNDHSFPAMRQRSTQWTRYGYIGITWLVMVSIAAQTFLVGLNVFLQPRWWGKHVNFGHLIGGMLLQLAVALVGQLDRRVRWLSAGMLLLFGLQYNHRVLAGLVGVPQLAALHAVNALLLFWCATTLGRWAWHAARSNEH